jgi:two-component system C4-dicarboxylate transport sensor histidine kinase DctB
MPRAAYILSYIMLSAMLAFAVYMISLQAGFDRLAQTGRVRIDQTSDRLLGQLSSFKQLPNILARHPIIMQAFDPSTDPEVLNGFLSNTSLLSGAREIFIINPDGHIINRSNKEASLGARVKDQPYVRAALNGRLGVFATLNPDDGARTIFISRGITPQPTRGVIVVAVDVAALEFEWHIDEEALAFFDADDVAFITNRSSLALRSIGTATPDQAMLEYDQSQKFGHILWALKNSGELPTEALIQSQYLPRLEMTARVLLPTTAARSAARLQAALAVAILFGLGVVLWALWLRRKNLSEQLAIEEAANMTLEARVEKRTAQLKLAQYQLVQAGKLTALGEMSAGISHELNQPLAAMQNYAENGAKMLDRDRVDDAKANFGLIKEQINRATRIISSLRAFARKEKETIEPVDLLNIINDSLSLSHKRISDAGVTVHRKMADGPAMVMGGHVRLQQVVINLLTNALDALDQSDEKSIFISLSQSAQTIAMTIRDTGEGLEDPARVFEPFYSTKDIGSSKGMGLGLSISHGIVGSFGGEMTCKNQVDGGAEFRVVLQRAAP